jgi:glutamine synthetase type III
VGQLLLTEVLSRAMADDCGYAVWWSPSPPPDTLDLLERQGFVQAEIETPRPLLLVDMRSPVVLLQNISTTLKEPFSSDSKVLSAIRDAHYRFQRALCGMYPGTLVLSLNAEVIYHRLVQKITYRNGVPSIPTFRRDTTDRNRTSPFAFTGKKFEFRMPGAAQNIAMPNIVLNTAVAKSFCEYADRLENAADFDAELHELLREVFTKHERILFSGNGYSREWEVEAESRGLCNYRRSVDVYPHMTDEENVELFEAFGVMNRTELASRQDILLENYAKIINIEAQTMIVMASREYIPAVEEYMCRLATTANQKREVLGPGSIGVEKDVLSKLSSFNEQAYAALEALKKADKDAISQGDHLAVARAFADRVVPAMQALRAPVDAMETLMPSTLWPVPTYGEMTYKQ